MAYVPQTPQLGIPPIASTLASSHRGGQVRCRRNSATSSSAVDPTYRRPASSSICSASPSTVVGSVVTYNGNASGTPTYQTALASAAGNKAQALAVAMSANVANQYGWYQIAGNAIVATNGTLAAGPAAVYLAGSGQLTSTQANGKQVENAINVTATGTPAANQAVVEINRPFAQGAIT
jgi:hypothetical protein